MKDEWENPEFAREWDQTALQMNPTRAYEEIFNKGKLDLADKLIAPDAVNHDPQLSPAF